MTDVIERSLGELSRRLDTATDERLLPGDVMARIGADTPPDRSSWLVVGGRAIGRRRRIVFSVLAAVAITAAAVLVLPGPRHAVARWFGIGSTRIERTPPTSSVSISASTATSPTTPIGNSVATFAPPPVTFPTSLGLGAPRTLDDARQATGLGIPLAADLGEPAGVFVVHPPNSGQVVVVYPPSDALPASAVAGVGALLSAVRGSIDDGGFVKTAASGTEVQSLRFYDSAGEIVDAVWLGGEPHQLSFLDSEGVQVWDTLRLATNTLLWERDGVTYRLEADISRSEATRIASSVTTD